jgi:hypothetical protein
MNEIEKYAVNLVGEGAEGIAEDDIDEDGEFADEADWRTASDLGVKMARAIKNNPEAFLAWYISIAPTVTA